MVRNIAVKKDSEAAEAMVAAEVMAAGVGRAGAVKLTAST
jgi:hypothetical protein